jgi:peptide/nickel transport system substrate-binding protein
MRRRRARALVLVVVAVVLAACSDSGRRPALDQTGQPPSEASARPARPLVIAVRYEVTDLAPKRVGGGPSRETKRPFNAALALIDGAGRVRPYVSETLPQLNSESWVVHSDGRMETTYRLKPHLTWHDGQPLSSEDFAFAYRVYSVAALGAFNAKPQDQMEEVLAPDPRTLVIRWRSLNGDAGALVTDDLDALPLHILEAPFAAYQEDPSTQDAFLAHPFWSTQYIGLGPFKLAGWDPGTSVEGVAFAGHALGRPRIDRIIVKVIGDENTVLSNMLAGTVDHAEGSSLRTEHVMVLKRQWDADQRGSALLGPGTRKWVVVQFRPQILRTQALLDLRVRRALAHAIDRDAINEALFEGQGIMSEHWVTPQTPYWADVERAITRYPFEPRRAEQLLGEAGISRDRSGFYANAAGERFRPHFLTDASPQFERETNVIQDTWARLGIEMEPQILPSVQLRVNESRATFPDLYDTVTGAREDQLYIFSEAHIASAARNWAGDNRGGWSSPEFERWWSAFSSTLDRSQRNQHIVEAMKVVTDQLPGFMLYFNPRPLTFVSALRGPEIQSPEALSNWNLHEWELR